ncbi:hypothetical protein ES705_34241 [subsurface metagenome]
MRTLTLSLNKLLLLIKDPALSEKSSVSKINPESLDFCASRRKFLCFSPKEESMKEMPYFSIKSISLPAELGLIVNMSLIK